MSKFHTLAVKAKSYGAKAVGAVSAVAFAVPAFAQDAGTDLASAVTDGIDKPTIMAIGAAVLGLAGVIALIRAGKRAAA